MSNIERIARALHGADREWSSVGGKPWGDLEESERLHWREMAEIALRAADDRGAVEAIKALRERVRPGDADPREDAYTRGYKAAVNDALETLVRGQS